MKTYTVADVAEILHANKRTIYIWIKQGKLQPVKVGRNWIFTESDIEKYLDNLRKEQYQK